MMFAAELTQGQLVVTGLASATTVVIAVIKMLGAAPGRESDAYQRGIVDEEKRCAQDIAALRLQLDTQLAEISALRAALLRLAVASRLTTAQRAEIAAVLGYRQLPGSPAGEGGD